MFPLCLSFSLSPSLFPLLSLCFFFEFLSAFSPAASPQFLPHLACSLCLGSLSFSISPLWLSSLFCLGLLSLYLFQSLALPSSPLCSFFSHPSSLIHLLPSIFFLLAFVSISPLSLPHARSLGVFFFLYLLCHLFLCCSVARHTERQRDVGPPSHVHFGPMANECATPTFATSLSS